MQVRARFSLWAFHCYPSRGILAFLSRLMLNTSGYFIGINELLAFLIVLTRCLFTEKGFTLGIAA
nr:hypothetical protein [uncultured bacterium]